MRRSGIAGWNRRTHFQSSTSQWEFASTGECQNVTAYLCGWTFLLLFITILHFIAKAATASSSYLWCEIFLWTVEKQQWQLEGCILYSYLIGTWITMHFCLFQHPTMFATFWTQQQEFNINLTLSSTEIVKSTCSIDVCLRKCVCVWIFKIGIHIQLCTHA